MNRLVKLSIVGTVVGGVVLLKDYFGSTSFKDKVNLEGKTVVITGANCGIGKETAREFSRKGATVVIGCRNMTKCKEARVDIVLETRNKKVFCKECDLSSMVSIRQFARDVHKISPQIDYLINNAAVMRCPKSVTKDGFETQFGTNHLGHFLLAMLLLDSIKKAAPSRILNVACMAHKRGKINFNDLNSSQDYDPTFAYNQSKLANVLFTVELARRLEGTGVTCNAVDPGIVNTELTRHMSYHKSWVAAIFIKPIMWFFVKSSHQGAEVILQAALSKDFDGVSGKYISKDKVEEPSENCQDREVAKRLWLISERWTQLT